MKRIAELTLPEIDYWVARAEGRKVEMRDGEWFVENDAKDWMFEMEYYQPTRSWAAGGPIVERLCREGIRVDCNNDGKFEPNVQTVVRRNGAIEALMFYEYDTYLHAAMVALLIKTHGASVPDEGSA